MSDATYFHDLALSKLALVFGFEKAERLVREVVADGGQTEILNAQDLLIFSGTLKQRGGFEATVGAMLDCRRSFAGRHPINLAMNLEPRRVLLMESVRPERTERAQTVF